jgi:hypothetical protein
MTSLEGAGLDARFEFGRVVGQTFSLIGRNFVLFVILALVFVGAPQFGLLYAQMNAIGAGDTGQMMVISLAALLVNGVMSFVLQGALTRAAVDDLSGSGVKAGAAIGDGLRFFFPLLLVAILMGIGLMLGFLLLIIPGIILAVRWSMTAPIVVIEQAGPTKSMGRSAELSSGHRWAIFGLILLYLVFAYALQIVLGVLLASFSADDPSQLMAMDALGVGYAVASSAVSAVIALVSTVGVASLYFELRRVKEGVGVAELANVFA